MRLCVRPTDGRRHLFQRARLCNDRSRGRALAHSAVAAQLGADADVAVILAAIGVGAAFAYYEAAS